jgi:dTDP-4-dehydrorhamnose reductase
MTGRRLALIGAGGQLACDLSRMLAGEVTELARRELDITDPVAVERVLDKCGPEVVVNAAGYNLVDRAEDEPTAAFAVNAFGVRNLARHCGRRGLTLVHVSTDYVFGGGPAVSRPLAETDMPLPLSAYGESKLAGEHFVEACCEKHFVIRTCGLYGVAATKAKGNFIETMLRLGSSRPEVRVVNDQQCTPSFTRDVAEAIASLVQTNGYGLYHLTNSGSMTWCELASEVFRQAKVDVQVTPITTAEFGAKAKRPAYSVLDCSKAQRLIGCVMPDWKDAVSRYLEARNRSEP